MWQDVSGGGGSSNILKSVTTIELSAGTQPINLPSPPYVDTDYDFTIYARDASTGGNVPFDYVSKTVSSITIELYESAIVTIITNKV